MKLKFLWLRISSSPSVKARDEFIIPLFHFQFYVHSKSEFVGFFSRKPASLTKSDRLERKPRVPQYGTGEQNTHDTIAVLPHALLIITHKYGLHCTTHSKE